MVKLQLPLLLAVLLPLTLSAEKRDLMKPYREPEAGIQRLVFQVPPIENEEDRKVEVLVGKVLSVDCNRSFFGGSLQEQTAKGWGYPYYVLHATGQRASTMMACPPDQPPRQAFVTVQGDGFFIRYNSKLPTVVYAPEGFEVRYRIWTAGDEEGRAESR